MQGTRNTSTLTGHWGGKEKQTGYSSMLIETVLHSHLSNKMKEVQSGGKRVKVSPISSVTR